MDKNMKIYVVLSRDRSNFIYTTNDKEKAEISRLEQTKDEEMSGGRPSVYIVESDLIQ